MIGAIIGDVVGSRFEFVNYKSKDFEMFDKGCDFTDDSVMTLAIAKALQPYEAITDYESFKKELVAVMHEVGMRYPHCGYGGHFYVWMMENHTEPYNSYGNGSAMRVAPVGWFANSLEECEALAAATAEVTHNHPEGVKGAVAVAGAIYLARTGSTTEEIKEYTKRYYTIDFTLDEIREDYNFYAICQKSVPQALEAFFESTNFEDAIRNAISIGGDSDTIAAITGSIAEAYYGADDDMKETALSHLDSYLLEIAESFVNKFIEKEQKKMERKNSITELVFILDRSGSMSGLEADTIGGFNSMIDKQRKEDGECYVSTVLFDSYSEVLHDRVKLSDIKPMTDEEYTVRGCTALIDAIGGAIHHIGNIHKYARPEDVPAHTMFIITTDGMENASQKYTSDRVKHMIERQKKRYGWEFLFIGANIDAIETAARYGIDRERAVNYNADKEGTRVVYESVAKAVCSVRNCEALSEDWCADIDADYKKRGKKSR